MLSRQLGLSTREAEVLLWIARGKTSIEAAAILDLSRRTVDKRLERIHAKIGVESRVAAALVAWNTLRGIRRGRTSQGRIPHAGSFRRPDQAFD
jgi:DNA-binding CsgD family transcriptional regulator